MREGLVVWKVSWGLLVGHIIWSKKRRLSEWQYWSHFIMTVLIVVKQVLRQMTKIGWIIIFNEPRKKPRKATYFDTLCFSCVVFRDDIYSLWWTKKLPICQISRYDHPQPVSSQSEAGIWWCWPIRGLHSITHTSWLPTSPVIKIILDPGPEPSCDASEDAPCPEWWPHTDLQHVSCNFIRALLEF